MRHNEICNHTKQTHSVLRFSWNSEAYASEFQENRNTMSAEEANKTNKTLFRYINKHRIWEVQIAYNIIRCLIITSNVSSTSFKPVSWRMIHYCVVENLNVSNTLLCMWYWEYIVFHIWYNNSQVVVIMHWHNNINSFFSNMLLQITYIELSSYHK